MEIQRNSKNLASCIERNQLDKLFSFIERCDLSKLPLGRTDIECDKLYIVNVDTQGADINTQPLELHRKYIDVHILLEGREKIGWKSSTEIDHFTQTYDEETDCALSDDKPQFYVDLIPGDFCIAYPQDAHAPAIGSGRIKKIIGKIKINK